jgi:hypothetical protein
VDDADSGGIVDIADMTCRELVVQVPWDVVNVAWSRSVAGESPHPLQRYTWDGWTVNRASVQH